MKTAIIALALLGFSTVAMAQEWQLACTTKGPCYVLHQSGNLYYLRGPTVKRLFLEEADKEWLIEQMLKDPKRREELYRM
ncbi:MAG: hypothetical protein O7C61_10305, partial [SAR324 cluster bacterium]|nr:hypothetical protein [SAR324 cluster bacterium]